MEEPIVRVEHLSHRYSVQWAIRDINFEINQKGILGLLGSNGAGKSTTMNIICGVLNQTEGTVYINGIDTRKNPVEAKKYIGFSFLLFFFCWVLFFLVGCVFFYGIVSRIIPVEA